MVLARHRPAEPIDLDIGVIYTHERQWMPPLLSSLAASGPGLNMRLLLVDNQSADGAEQWAPLFPHTEILHNVRRLHYSANLNVIARASTAPYVLLLNTDMEFTPHEHCLLKMVQFMRSHPQCGLSGCALYRADGSFAHPARRHQTLKTILARRCGLGRWLSSELRQYLYQDRDPGGQWECQWLSGCFLMARRQALESIGRFDEEFIKYFEDVDVALRMARAGWQVLYNGRTYCHHLEQRASRRFWSRDAWQHLRSYGRWLSKWGFSPDFTPVLVPQHKAAA